MTYIFAADSWPYWSIFVQMFVVGSKNAQTFLQQSAYRPFKIIQGRWFWHHSKALMRLPISPPL